MSNRSNNLQKTGLGLFVTAAVLITSVFVKTQDIVQSDDISGGSSVFVFRKSSKAAQSKFAPRAVVRRSEVERVAIRKSSREQIAKVVPKRAKKSVANPDALLAQNTKPKSVGRKGGKSATPDSVLKQQSSAALASIGDTYLERGSIDQAIDAYRKSLTDYPKNETAKSGLSEALTKKGDSVFEMQGARESVRFYEEAKNLDLKNAAAFAGLGLACDELEDSDAAMRNYQTALGLNANLTELYAPLGTIYYEKGEIAKADEYLSKAIAANAGSLQTKYLLGLIRYNQNRNDEAIAALKSLDTAESHYYLGEVYDRLKRDEEAVKEYKIAVAKKDKYFEAWFDLGAAYYNRENYAEAVSAYERAVQINNASRDAFENLADAYRQLGRNATNLDERTSYYGKAEGNYNLAILYAERSRQAAEKNGKDFDIKGLADLYSKAGFIKGRLSKWEDAIAYLNKANQISPDYVDYTNAGWAYYNSAMEDDGMAKMKTAPLTPEQRNQKQANARTKLQKAKEVLQTAVSMNQNSAGTFMNLGLTLNNLGEYQAALPVLEKCLTLRKDWLIALNETGIAYRGLNMFDKAADFFKLARNKDKTYYWATFNLAETEFKRGNTKEAKKLQNELRKINPNLANQLEVVFLGGVLTNPTQKMENKVKSKIPKIPGLPY